MTARQLAAAWRAYPTGHAYSAMAALLAEQQQDGILFAASPQYDVSDVALSPDGKLMASADSGGTIRLWNPAIGQAADPPIPPTPAAWSSAWCGPGRVRRTWTLPNSPLEQ